jgi:hypothetical protein
MRVGVTLECVLIWSTYIEYLQATPDGGLGCSPLTTMNSQQFVIKRA